MRILPILILMAFCLAGCAIARIPRETIVPTRIITSTVTVVPLTATPQPTATVFVPEGPSETPEPSQTPEPSETPEPTTTVTVDEQVAQIIGNCPFTDTLDHESNPIVVSPQKKWRMFACESDNPEDGIVSKFINEDGSKVWTVSYNDLYIKPYHKEIPTQADDMRNRMFYPQEWTYDQDFVYMTVDLHPALFDQSFFYVPGMFRLNLQTGEVSPTLAPADGSDQKHYNYKFSWDGTELAYLDQAVLPLTVVIKDLTTDATKKFTLEPTFAQGGHMLWSWDDNFLVLSLVDGWAESEKYVLILFDLQKMKYEVVLRGHSDAYLPDIWVNEHTFSVTDTSDGTYYINVLTKEVGHQPPPRP